MTPPQLAAGVASVALRRGPLRSFVLLLLVLAFVLTLLPAFLLVGLVSQQVAAPTAPAAGGLPSSARPWIPLIAIASKTYRVNPYLMLAVLSEETGFGTHPDTYGANYIGCCHGPFQINMLDGTWLAIRGAYRAAPRPDSYHHPVESHPSPYDSFDAAMAAAALLRIKAGGRPLLTLDGSAWAAARAYNGAGPVASAYADRVMALARRWQSAADIDAPTPAPTGDPAGLTWPVAGPVVSPFGQRWGRLHAGIDIAGPTGTPIRAAADGRVVIHGWTGGYGRLVCVHHSPRVTTCYAHLSAFAEGAALHGQVLRGQIVGYVGCTGHCFGPHLHFEVRTSPTIAPGNAVDPISYLSGRAG